MFVGAFLACLGTVCAAAHDEVVYPTKAECVSANEQILTAQEMKYVLGGATYFKGDCIDIPAESTLQDSDEMMKSIKAQLGPGRDA